MTSQLPPSRCQTASAWFAGRFVTALGTPAILLLPAVVVVGWLYAIQLPLMTGCGILLYRVVPSPGGDKA